MNDAFTPATLALITRLKHLALEDKQTGDFGSGFRVGPGGRNLPNESDVDCVIRETLEEVGIALHKDHLKRVAEIISYRYHQPWFRVQVFLAQRFKYVRREPKPEMTHDWYRFDKLPIAEMPPSDLLWLPRVLRGEKLRVTLQFNGQGTFCHSHEITKLIT